MMNFIDANNNAIFNVVLHYIIIKYQYVKSNMDPHMFFSELSRLLDSVMFIIHEDYLVPNCIYQYKIRIEVFQLVLCQWKDIVLYPTTLVSNEVLSYNWNQISNTLLY